MHHLNSTSIQHVVLVRSAARDTCHWGPRHATLADVRRELLQMLYVATIGSPTRTQALMQRLHSHAVGRWNLSHIEHIIKLDNNIPEKMFIWLLIILLITQCL